MGLIDWHQWQTSLWGNYRTLIGHISKNTRVKAIIKQLLVVLARLHFDAV